MKKIILRGKYKNATVLVSDKDYSLVRKYKWYGLPRENGNISVWRNEGNKIIYLHRFIMNPLINQEIDHINHNPLDNRRINLRFCDRKQNCQNRKNRKKNSSGYKGVFIVSNPNQIKKYYSRITVNKKIIPLGYFKYSIDAAKKYNLSAIKYFGKFASLNIIN